MQAGLRVAPPSATVWQEASIQAYDVRMLKQGSGGFGYT